MATDGVNVFTASQQAPGDCLGPVELWHGPRPDLWPDDRGHHPRLCVGLLRKDNPGTTPRLVSGCPAQKRGQTGPQTAHSGGEWLFCPAALLGGGLDRSHLPSAGPRHGRLNTGATLHDPLDQRGGARLCHSRGLAYRRSHAAWCLAPPLGSPLWVPPGQCACGLDRDRAGRPGLVRTLAVYDHSSAGVASLLADQSPRPLSSACLSYQSSADAGREPRRAAVGRPGRLLYHPRTTTGVHPLGALGCRLSRPVVDPHRPPADGCRCGVVWVARLDRVWLQRQQTRRLALGTDQDARPGAGRAALARCGGGNAVDGQCGLSGRSRATPTPGAPAPRATYRPQAGHGATPTARLSGFRRGRLVILAALCLGQPWPMGAILPELWPSSHETTLARLRTFPPLPKVA